MNAFITSDVSGRQGEVKSAMLANGFHDYWTANNQTYYLPNTCLWKPDSELNAALLIMQQVIQNLNWNQPIHNQIRLERCIVISATPWDGIPGESRRN